MMAQHHGNHFMKSKFRVLAINLIIFISFCLLLEIGYRLVLLNSTCHNYSCDFDLISKLKNKLYRESSNIGFVSFDDKFGYIPTPGFNMRVNYPNLGWNDVKVTINEFGYRITPKTNNESNILVGGDSFAFGDQLSDEDTWAWCLASRTKRNVDNTAVFAYGGLQALLRMEDASRKKNYSTAILSILLGEDFKRDKYFYYGGFPRPSLSNVNGHFRIDYPNTNSIEFNARFGIVNHLASISYVVNDIYNFSMQNYKGSYLYFEYNQNSPSVDDVVKYVIDRYSKLDVKTKYVLFAYNGDANTADQIADKESVYRYARNKDIIVIDPYLSLTKYPKDVIWSGHYTLIGANVICDELTGVMH